MLGFLPLTSAPLGDDGAIQSSEAYILNDITTGNPSLGNSSIVETSSINLLDITTGNPSIGNSSIVETGSINLLDITTGNIYVQTTDITEDSNLSLITIETGLPVIGESDLIYVVLFSLNSISTGTPYVGDIAFSSGTLINLGPIETGFPTLSTSNIFQTYYITTSDITTGVPTLQSGSISEKQELFALNFYTGIPELNTSLISQLQNISPTSAETDQVIITRADLLQRHIIVSVAVNTGVPIVSDPTAIINYVLQVVSLVLGSPFSEPSVFRQTNRIVTEDIVTEAAFVSLLNIIVKTSLFGSSILTESPVFGLVYYNGSIRRIIPINGNTDSFVDIVELYNDVELADNNYATLVEDVNGVVVIETNNNITYLNESNKVE